MTKFLDSSGLAVVRDWVKSLLKSKQDKLVSGQNIKTVGGHSILGNGNIETSDIGSIELQSLLSQKQDTLDSGDTVGTINGKTLKWGGTVNIETGDVNLDNIGAKVTETNTVAATSEAKASAYFDSAEELFKFTFDIPKGADGKDGAAGKDGDSDSPVTIFIYRYYSSSVSSVSVPTGGGYIKQEDGTYLPTAPDGWSTTMPTTSDSTNKLWVTSGIFSKAGTIQSWGVPICLSPSNTSGGSGGLGFDTEFTEYIYKSAATEEEAAKWEKPNNDTTQDKYVPTSQGWTDHPAGLTTEKPYIYYYFRIRTYTESTQTLSEWSDWNSDGPLLWAAWGQKGQDGDGVEYIFTRTASNDLDKIPNIPTFSNVEDTNIDDLCGTDENGVVWTDDPADVTSELPYQWVCQRKGTTGAWEAFTSSSEIAGKAALWNKWGEDGESVYRANAFIRADADYDWTTDTDKLYSSIKEAGDYATPITEAMTTLGWSDGIPEVDGVKGVWMITRLFSSKGTKSTVQESNWTTPIYAVDSENLDVCYHIATESGEAPTAPEKDSHPSQGNSTSGWHDIGNKNDVWMAISTHDKNGWSDWSIMQIKGEKGNDGYTILLDLSYENAKISYDEDKNILSPTVTTDATLLYNGKPYTEDETNKIVYGVELDSDGLADGLTVALSTASETERNNAGVVYNTTTGEVTVNSLIGSDGTLENRNITITATKDGITYKKVFAVEYVLKQSVYRLTANNSTVKVVDGECKPSSIKIYVQKSSDKTTYTNVSTLPTGFHLYIDGGVVTDSDYNTNGYYTCKPSASDANINIQLIDTNNSNFLWASENIPVLRDGDSGSVFRLDLTNENDSILYSSATGSRVSGAVSTTAVLYEGSSPVTGKIVTYSVISTDGEGIIKDDTSYYTCNSSTGVVTVNKVDANGWVLVQAECEGNYYTSQFNVKKLIDVDKYDLIISDNAVKADTSSCIPATITITFAHTSQSGGRVILYDIPTDSNDSEIFTLDITDENGKTYTPSHTSGTGYKFNPDPAKTKYTIAISNSDGQLDAETIPVLHDGDSGSDDSGKYWIQVSQRSVSVDSSNNIIGDTFSITATLYYTDNGTNKIVTTDTTKSTDSYHIVDKIQWYGKMDYEGKGDYGDMGDNNIKSNPCTFDNDGKAAFYGGYIQVVINDSVTKNETIDAIKVPDSTEYKDGQFSLRVSPAALTFETDTEGNVLVPGSDSTVLSTSNAALISLYGYYGNTEAEIKLSGTINSVHCLSYLALVAHNGSDKVKDIAIVTIGSESKTWTDSNGKSQTSTVYYASGYVTATITVISSDDSSVTKNFDINVPFTLVDRRVSADYGYLKDAAGNVSGLQSTVSTLSTQISDNDTKYIAQFSQITQEINKISLKVGESTLDSNRGNLLSDSYPNAVFYSSLYGEANYVGNKSVKLTFGKNYVLTAKGKSFDSSHFLRIYLYRWDDAKTKWIDTYNLDFVTKTTASDNTVTYTPDNTLKIRSLAFTLNKDDDGQYDTGETLTYYVDAYIMTNNTETAESSSSYRAHLQWITIEEGTESSGEYMLSENDYYAKPNLLNGTKSITTGVENGITSIGGTPTYGDVEDNTVTEVANLQYVQITNSSSADIDITFADAIDVKAQTSYTASVWVKATGNGSFAMHLYNGDSGTYTVDGVCYSNDATNTTTNGDGGAATLPSVYIPWRHISVTWWQLESNANMDVLFRIPKSDTSITYQLAGFKLREGGRVDDWTDYGKAALKASDLDLLATGIDIEKKQITLTADNLVCKNNNGDDTLKLDADGNLTVTGTVNATSGTIGGVNINGSNALTTGENNIGKNGIGYVGTKTAAFMTLSYNSSTSPFKANQQTGEGVFRVVDNSSSTTLPAFTAKMSNAGSGIAFATNGRVIADRFRSYYNPSMACPFVALRVYVTNNGSTASVTSYNSYATGGTVSATRTAQGVVTITLGTALPSGYTYFPLARADTSTAFPVMANVAQMGTSQIIVATGDDSSCNDCNFELIVLAF